MLLVDASYNGDVMHMQQCIMGGADVDYLASQFLDGEKQQRL